MNNTHQNIVSDSPSGTHIVITTNDKNGNLHNWDWVISDEDLCDHTDWTRRDLRTVTDEMIRSVEFPDGVEGFFVPDDLDY
jgi:hypothetical protein